MTEFKPWAQYFLKIKKVSLKYFNQEVRIIKKLQGTFSTTESLHLV